MNTSIPSSSKLTGYTLAEVLGKNPRILKSGEKSPEAYRELWQTITAGKEWRGEFHNKKKNGELYWESASISPIRDFAGRVTHYVAVKEDITARKQTEAERDMLIHDLQDALANVKSLSGLLPICASCKKIRDDKGYWSQVESYIQKHSDATFTHGMCPDCIKKWYPDLVEGGLGGSHPRRLHDLDLAPRTPGWKPAIRQAGKPAATVAADILPAISGGILPPGIPKNGSKTAA